MRLVVKPAAFALYRHPRFLSDSPATVLTAPPRFENPVVFPASMPRLQNQSPGFGVGTASSDSEPWFRCRRCVFRLRAPVSVSVFVRASMLFCSASQSERVPCVVCRGCRPRGVRSLSSISKKFLRCLNLGG